MIRSGCDLPPTLTMPTIVKRWLRPVQGPQTSSLCLSESANVQLHGIHLAMVGTAGA